MNDHRPPSMIEKHRMRAQQAIASHLCVIELTDGFCRPLHGICVRMVAARRDCGKRANSILRALETNGVRPVWVHDGELAPMAARKREDAGT